LRTVTAWATERNTTVNADAVIGALKTLISEGLAQAYLLSANHNVKAEAVAFSEDRLDELWFM
jgi:hypothetical protein